ncbi:polysaccharide deacetylase family protein [Aurantimonas sp. VKM B-3413]|uniref:polysaccharide deacetylase family protein n=1 Tax=Aurantimonas sp. VKM B-3413 TaxID=2779401 RepID=UPI001E3237D4|nr:polysaccharide deacetylase family protein [Aurantimonas sp. VKM B-3413]MCB8836720.1 polysaccharide deacetylase family protein [Aurantimonas sp. VKM B-3413]
MTIFSKTRARLDALSGEGRTVSLWWRDDDARWSTRALGRLLATAGEARLPLALAVIPEKAEASLAEAIADRPEVAVLLHGWRHANHAPAGEKRAEFGDHRPAAEMAGEIAEGRDRLQGLFGERLLPVFVPPWNRIGTAALAELVRPGLSVLSVYGPARCGGPAELNAHLDIMDWRAMRGLGLDELDRLAADALELWSSDTGRSHEPLGLLTHHLQHDAGAWYALEHLLEVLAGHPCVRWPQVESLVAAALAGERRPGGEAEARAGGPLVRKVASQ